VLACHEGDNVYGSRQTKKERAMTETATYDTDTSDMLIPHGMFRAAFATADRVIDAVPAGDAPRVAAAHSYFDNVLRFLDAHHGGEDAIVWPVLTERCAEAADLIRRMEAEHGSVHLLRERAGTALATWYGAPSPDNARALTRALAALRVELEDHFHEEEKEVLPLASCNMSAEEWGALPGHAMAHFTGDKVWLVLGLVFEQMTPEQLSSTFTLLPPPVVDMWGTSGKAAFDQFVAQVRGTG
jgi:hemerythrin-like domain-containing protein